jgi:uncharacterized OsmC-like protein
MTDAIRAALEGAGTYLADHPDEARYTDSLATARLGDALHVAVEGPQGERIETDMPAGIGGRGVAPGPGWLLRASVAACVASVAAMRAAQLGLRGFRCEVDVDSESDDRGILGLDPGVPAGPLSLRIAIRLAADESGDEPLRDLATWAIEHCPVADAVRRSVPVTVEVEVESG